MLPSWTTDPETPLPEAEAATPEALRGWRLRAPQENDAALRASFSTVLRASAALPPDRRLVMYDADDGGARSAPLEGPALPPASSPFRKRLDARRNAKPKKPDEQRRVCTPFDPDAFHFGKIRNPAERLLRLQLTGGRYDLLTNKFPLFPKHMLLVSASLVPQQMTLPHLRSVGELIRPSSFCAYFNSWCASASVNHFHCHVIDELPPVAKLALVPGAVLAGGVETLRPDGFPGHCYVYGWSQVGEVGAAVWAMQKANQPHNLLFSPKHVYVWPKPLQRPARSWDLYPETVGGPELLGSFTVYLQPDFDKLTAEHAAELFAINTAPLPAIRAPLPPRIRSADPAADGRAADDSDAPISDAGGSRRALAAIRPSQSLDSAGSVLCDVLVR